MKHIRSHLVFNKSQRNGIFLLVLIIIVLQLLYFFGNFVKPTTSYQSDNPELVLFQKKLDSIKLAKQAGDTLRIFPFNPNFITDYRGYTLGMTVEEIDRLHAFRAEDKWVNSAADFQKVTGISDSLLKNIEPYFRFPDWVTQNRPQVTNRTASINASPSQKQDLNAASVEDLVAVRGIGETLASRIVNYRNRIGGFVDDLQLKDIYGLNFETRNEVLKNFTVKNAPQVELLNINTASVLELSNIPYIDYELAREIVNYRLLNDNISSFEELAKIKEFPSEKIDRIALYLTLK
ncbi:helix-hairpin-helix domain-containing protein [Antarcticibacterium arcticum]|uniref:Helix-hairpin-helix domain-containing protein n=1 Tax=Antarcticibacterium arcticum TaxID=2585771 RepID=A0A5B8YI96_9FLAO|nr:helix-hairpin-helix domain-containing protein [Antarcticibacterium arcticum]QED37670.1 helix-hairpin-helix domain-containing protein [Antarcticibacterium arcticum]